jgi:uncharacterized protein with HEPN domain
LAQHFLADCEYEVFRDDLLCFYAITRCLEIISEASRRLPDDLKAGQPSITWQKMAASGNVYRHEYKNPPNFHWKLG